jgi:hypothetical protein
LLRRAGQTNSITEPTLSSQDLLGIAVGDIWVIRGDWVVGRYWEIDCAPLNPRQQRESKPSIDYTPFDAAKISVV